MPNASVEDLERAVAQLSRLEKGQQTMRDLLALVENGGISLDTVNQRQVLGLISGAWRNQGGTVLESLRDVVNLEEELVSIEAANPSS